MSAGKSIATLSWKEAEALIHEHSIIVIPLGASSKEHGLHLQLRNDQLIAEYLSEQIVQQSDVLLLPTITYFYYPAFVDYPGSISLSSETSANLIYEICTSISRFGPSRFYVLNTGISTLAPLAKAAGMLKQNAIELSYTDFDAAMHPAITEVSEQEGGSHADEIETSIMLYIAPNTVRMDLAANDFIKDADGPLRRQFSPGVCYSKSGVWGNARLASKEKGEKIVKCLIKNILRDIEILKSAP